MKERHDHAEALEVVRAAATHRVAGAAKASHNGGSKKFSEYLLRLTSQFRRIFGMVGKYLRLVMRGDLYYRNCSGNCFFALFRDIFKTPFGFLRVQKDEPLVCVAETGMPEQTYRIETEQEDDGRWIAEIVDLPGVLAYGSSQEEAIANVEALAFRVIADRIEETKVGTRRVSFCG